MPFTQQQFFEVFSHYNQTVGLTVIVFYALAALSLYLIWSGGRQAFKLSLLFLGFLWLWMGVVYHWFFFARINPGAWLFGGLFVVEAFLLFRATAAKRGIEFDLSHRARNTLSTVFIIYALLIYPLLGLLEGQGYPNGPVFGLPCPTTIFTFAVLLLIRGDKTNVAHLFFIPLLWSVVGSFATVKLGVAQDAGLFLAGFTSALVLARDSKRLLGSFAT